MNRLKRHWLEAGGFVVFLLLSVAGLTIQAALSSQEAARYAAVSNIALSIGTGGLVSYAFYYMVNERTEKRRRALLHSSVKATYLEAKEHIAWAIIHASQKGGRTDLTGDLETHAKAMSAVGFKALFAGGQESHEGYYAFVNQMRDATPEYEEIVFNLNVIARAADRLIDNNVVDDAALYQFFVRLSTLMARIERNGPGYDESKALCNLLWSVFAGWDMFDGDVGYDRIERAIDQLRGVESPPKVR